MLSLSSVLLQNVAVLPVWEELWSCYTSSPPPHLVKNRERKRREHEKERKRSRPTLLAVVVVAPAGVFCQIVFSRNLSPAALAI